MDNNSEHCVTDYGRLVHESQIYLHAKTRLEIPLGRRTIGLAAKQLGIVAVLHVESDDGYLDVHCRQGGMFYRHEDADKITGFLKRHKQFGIEEFKKQAAEKGGNAKLDDLYLIRHKNGLTKIGRSHNPQCRERTLQSEDPFLNLLGIVSGGGFYETRLHRALDHRRKRGEWFDLTESQCHWILSLKDIEERKSSERDDNTFEEKTKKRLNTQLTLY
jgi:hypothetical protein